MTSHRNIGPDSLLAELVKADPLALDNHSNVSTHQKGDRVKSIFGSCRRFLTAEEVPRWFGLSIVLIYSVGLISVGKYALSATRQEGAAQFHQNSAYSVKLLADRLSALDGSASKDGRLAGCGRVLKEFAVNVPAKKVRVVGGARREVHCSTDASELGRESPAQGEPVAGLLGMETFVLADEVGQEPTWMVRAPIGTRMSRTMPVESSHIEEAIPGPADLATGYKTADGLFVEAVFPRMPPTNNQWVHHAGTLVIALAVLGTLFVTYRCLREQMRGVSRIAHRLESHRDHLEQEIGSLRIGDEMDAVTQSWNQLVDMTEGLLHSSREKKADEELTKVLQRSGGGALAEAMNALPDGIIHVVDESRLDYLNSTACRLMGWKPQECKRPLLHEAKAEGVGEKILELIRSSLQPDSRFESRVDLIEVGAEGIGRDQSSYRVWLLPLQGSRHTGECLVMIRDVSQQLRAEKAREEFIAQVTHEFRTPLTNIRAYTETLSSGMFEDPQVISECYNVITKETRRLSRLIEDILSVSQLEVGSIELRTDNVDLRTLLTEGVRDVRGLAEEKNIDVQLVLPAKLETIRGDRDKLAVVVNNLLGNAIKYTPPGGNVIVGCQASAEAVVITVKDNGMGISAADQLRVFEKFQRGTDPEVQNITGTGIGLFTAREIVRRHGGDIELISEKGSGSTFMARLPHRESRGSALTTAQTGGEHG
jgi:signal transduction histidine kinase